MKLLAEANQDEKFNKLIGRIQTSLGGIKGQPPGLLELAVEFGDGGIKPVNSQRHALDQAIADLQKVRAMMFNS